MVVNEIRCAATFALIMLIASCYGCDDAGTKFDTAVIEATQAAGMKPFEPGRISNRAIDDMDMVFVPGGQYTMGSTTEEVDFAVAVCNEFVANCLPEWFNDEMPAHPVSLTSYWIDRTEVTNGQFAACVAAGACAQPTSNVSVTRSSYYGDAAFTAYPVLNVTADDANAYCTWVGAQLPTEAQWEYAARGPQNLRYPWGNEFDGSRLNYCDANCGYSWMDPAFNDGFDDTAPVGSFPTGASWCGALDLAGNAWEWVADYNGPYPTEAVADPAGPMSGEMRVIRGGSWDHERCDVRSAYRTWFHPSEQYGEWDVTPGFRCASSSDPGR